MQWARLSAALTSCMSILLDPLFESHQQLTESSDVFMDSINRDVSMRLMVRRWTQNFVALLRKFEQVNAARKSVGKQFILITPQSMGNVDSGPDVKIIKFVSPVRSAR